MQQRDLGMDIDQVLVLQAPTNIPDSLRQGSITTFTGQVQSLPYVGGVGLSETIPGNGTSDLNSTSGSVYRTRATEVRSPTYYIYDINEGYLNSLHIPLVAGHNFSDQPEQNKDKIIINEHALEKLGFASAGEAIGARLYWGNDYRPEIIGVVRNYNHLALDKDIIPLIFFYDQVHANYFTIRLVGGQAKHDQVIAELQHRWKESFGANVFEHFYLDQRFNAQYSADQQFSRLFTLFTVLAVFIACLGLLGLSAHSVMQRTKEIGIRKVLGASVTEIIGTLSTDFMKLIVLAIFIAALCSSWVIHSWLSTYAFRIGLSWWILAIPAVLLLLIAMMTIGYHTAKAASANPVDALKSD
jgi:putative ABC transport system permease protein